MSGSQSDDAQGFKDFERAGWQRAAMAAAAEAYATAEGALKIPMSAVLATARKG